MNFSIFDNQGNEIDYIINDISTINLKDTKVSFSPLPDDFYKKVNISFYADIDGVGYRTYYIKEGRTKAISSDETLVHENVLENEYIKAEVLGVNSGFKLTHF